MPDRLPSLIVLAGFWIPPAIAGAVAAARLHRGSTRARTAPTYATLTLFVLAYAAAWFLYNVGRMPPYIPGAVMDPTIATPRAVRALAIFTSLLVLPGSALAFLLAFRWRRRTLDRASTSHASA